MPTLTMVSGADPVFVTVTVLAAVAVPTRCDPKSRPSGVMVTIGTPGATVSTANMPRPCVAATSVDPSRTVR